MKGLWKTKVSGWNKDSKRKRVNKNQVFSDNSVYNIKKAKYDEIGYQYFLKRERICFPIVFGKLDDWNKRRQFETNLVDRKTRCRTREYIAEGNWGKEIKDVDGSKSVDYLVS